MYLCACLCLIAKFLAHEHGIMPSLYLGTYSALPNFGLGLAFLFWSHFLAHSNIVVALAVFGPSFFVMFMSDLLLCLLEFNVFVILIEAVATRTHKLQRIFSSSFIRFYFFHYISKNVFYAI